MPEPRAVPLSRLVPALMAPTFLVITTMAMFAVAIPSIRLEFALTADVTSWTVIAYTLPFMVFMPVYGRLGDGIGKKNLFIAGIVVFIVGSVGVLFAPSLMWIFVARAVQGAGAAGINPLSMAIIIEHAPPEKRGNALGTWNSIGPVSGIIGPLIAGAMIDSLGWRSILVPALVIGVFAVFLSLRLVPRTPGASTRSAPTVIRSFDWVGVLLLSLCATFLVFYTSSRPITGLAPLTDFRLLGGFLVAGFGFFFWERRRANAFVDLRLFRNRNFTFASISVGMRMALMGGIAFIAPLLVTDLFGFSAAATGSILMLHAAALLVTMRLGGYWIDRWKSRMQIVAGLLIESAAMVAFAMMPPGAGIVYFIVVIMVHGLGAGFCLAALHIFALAGVPADRSATAAGLYSMVRFGGAMIGTAVGGVVLASGIASFGATYPAYSRVFWFYLVVSLIGALSALGLTRHVPGLHGTDE